MSRRNKNKPVIPQPRSEISLLMLGAKTMAQYYNDNLYYTDQAVLLAFVEIMKTAGRIEELTNLKAKAGLSTVVFQHRLDELSQEIGKKGIAFKNAVLKKNSPKGEELIQLITNTISDTQDAVNDALSSGNIEALLQISQKDHLNAIFIQYLETLDRGGKEPTGMSPERKYLAERAIKLKRQFSRKGWWQIGIHILHEIGDLAKPTEEQIWAKDKLLAYCDYTPDGYLFVADKTEMGTYLSNLKGEYQKEVSR